MDNILEQLSDLKIDNEHKQHISKEEVTIGKKIEDNLKKTGLVLCNNQDSFTTLDQELYDKFCQIPNRLMNNEEKILFHQTKSNEDFDNFENDEKSIGSCLELFSGILDEKIENGLILIDKLRLYSDLISSIIETTIQKHGLKRVVVLDLNNDSSVVFQQKFYNDSNVLYFSIHHFTDGVTQTEKNFEYIGEENGKGFNINIAFNENLPSESEYMASFFNIVLPILYEFNPELIFMPFSFEHSQLTPNIYGHFIHYLSCVANGKIALIADGSLSSDHYKDCVYESVRSLMGYPCRRLDSLVQPSSKSILNTISVLRPYWCCLQLLNIHDMTEHLNDFLENHKNRIIIKTENQSQISEIKCQNFQVQKTKKNCNELSVNRTCVCSDLEMMKHYNLISEHPERPDRIKRILEALKEKGLYERCVELNSRNATEKELELCHPVSYIEQIKSLRGKTEQELKQLSKNPDSVFYHSSTFDCASLATGCLLQVVDQVCTNKCLNGVGVIRPPGHHAYPGSCSGFCFFNSIAIAARYAQQNYQHIKKVLILDFDIHHGNGTQDIFFEDDSVLFISLHRYDNGFFYPIDAGSNYDEVGKGKGKGFNINIPWNQQTAGDAEYTAAFLRVVMPVAYQFNPDLVLVSAGFDGATGDPLGRYNITPSGFAQMTKMLCSLAEGRVILGLEGGYNLTSISESMASCVSILLGDKCPSIPPINAKPKAYESIRNVIRTQKEFWSCFNFDETLPNCEYIKKFKPENKSKNKNIPVGENSYSLRSRNKPPNDEANDTKNENKQEQIKKPKSSKPNLPDLPPLDEDTVDISEISTAFSVIPLSYCPHLLEINKKIDPNLIDINRPCFKCNSQKENWICLSCFECGCSRFVKEHMAEHHEQTKHPMVLSFSDLSVWCYICDSYVHNDLLSLVKEIAYASKFG